MPALCLMTNMTSTEVAAWVQALGSVLAIIAAVLLARQQFAAAAVLQRAALQAERTRRYSALEGFVGAAIAEFTEALEALRSDTAEAQFKEVAFREMFDEFKMALQQVSPLDMPSGAGAAMLVKLRNLIGTAASTVQAPFLAAGEFTGDFATCADALADNVREMSEVHARLKIELVKSATA